MRRILVSWHGHDVYSYPAFLSLGLVLGVYGGAAVAAAEDVSADRFMLATTLLLGPALVAARLWFVLGHLDVYRREPRRILRRGEGGLAMYGGLLVAVPLSIPVVRAFGLPFGKFWDAATVTMLAGMVVTRFGCLLNGCCAGRETSSRFGLVLADDRGRRVRRIPTQLLEAAWGGALLCVCLALRGHTAFTGELLVVAAVGYGAGRVALEGLRGESDGGRARRANRITSAAIIVAAVATLLVVALR